jgi:hypothetical protein
MMQEIQPNRDEKEDDRHWTVDDINIPLVAVSVAFFGVLLLTTIISLQAWFYNAKARETAEKTLPQEDSHTDLGALLQKQRNQLESPAGYIVAESPATAPATGAATGAAAASKPAPLYHIPIDVAMEQVSRQYSEGSR